MEEDKKKRKNKKKKNKQATKPTESVTRDARESTSESQSHVLEREQNSNGQGPGVIDSSNDVGGHIDVDKGGNHVNVGKGTNLAEAEKQYQLDREVSFQEKVKEIEAEKDAHIQKQSFLEQRIKQLLKEKAENAQREASEREKVEKLQDEKNAFMQNEALLEERIKQLLKESDENVQEEASEREKIKQLHDEKNASMQNEASLKEKLTQLEKEKDALSHNEGILEQKILQLQKEVEVHLQKEASLEAKILQLEGEKNSWVQKEVGFEDKINQLVDEAAFLNLERNSTKDSFARLTNENIKLRAQVIELEQSKESLLEENQQLTQTVSSVRFQTNNLESSAGIRHSSIDSVVTSEADDANYQIEAARALVEKLIMENSELVEKVNELYAELNRRGLRSEQFSSSGSVPGAVVPDLTIGANRSHIAGQFLENVIVETHGELVEVDDGCGLASSSEIITEADDESEIRENNLGDDEKTNVFLTDAPLIGAPFRLISFVARYVSGADLVNKKAGE